MNRIVIAALLALVAVGAGGIWALGQFGGSSAPVVSEARPPIVREPEVVVAAAEPAAPAPTTPAVTQPAPAKPKAPKATPTPAPAKTEPQAAPTPAPVEPAVTPQAVTPPAAVDVTPAPAAPATQTDPAKAAKDALRSALGKAGIPTSVPKPSASTLAPTTLAPGSSTPAPSTPAPAAPAAAPAAEPAAPPAAAEPTVTVQNVPGPSAAQPKAKVTTTQAAGVADSVVTQVAAPVGLEAQFKSRRVTYNRPPEKLALNKPVDVSLVINATEDADAGKEALQGFKGEIVERQVDLSDTVSAQLTGPGFDIVTQTVERQRLSGRTVNRWQWRVTPTEEGEHTLMLEIFGYASGSLDAEPLDAYRDVIAVEVEQLDQIVTWAKSVQPLFAVLAAMAGIGSACFAFLRFRNERKQAKAAKSE